MTESISSLLREFREGDPEIQWQAVRAMREMGDEAEPAIPTLLEAIPNVDAESREHLCEALCDFEGFPPRTIPALVDLLALDLQEVDDLVTHALTLPRTNRRETVKALTNSLRDGSPHAREQSAFLLGELDTRSREALNALRAAVCGDDTAVSSAAQQALDLIRTPSAVSKFNWPRLCEGRFDPSTDQIAFLELDVDDAARAYGDWTSTWGRIGRAVELTSVEDFGTEPFVLARFAFRAPLIEAFEHLATISAFGERYEESQLKLYLFIQTQSAWTATFEYLGPHSQTPCADLSGFVRVLSERESVRGLKIDCHPAGPKHDAAVIFALSLGKQVERVGIPGLFDIPGDFENADRSLWLANGGSRYEFIHHGHELPFEETQNYTARRVRERFTPDMLERYCAALGIHPWEETYYGERCWIFARRFGASRR